MSLKKSEEHQVPIVPCQSQDVLNTASQDAEIIEIQLNKEEPCQIYEKLLRVDKFETAEKGSAPDARHKYILADRRNKKLYFVRTDSQLLKDLL